MNPYRTAKWYRSRRGIIFGVCQGLAEWKDMSAGMIRCVLLLIFFFTGGLIMLLVYLGLAIVLPVEPRGPDGRRRGKRSPFDDDPYDFRSWRDEE
ncbi:MAG: PspC domain-containing protein [Spirochaetales bacterium]|jgi:phage shock protein C|nr:PspC domain-containing protein [Spirochaetales bacterium]